jgi:hypothetical protein
MIDEEKDRPIFTLDSIFAVVHMFFAVIGFIAACVIFWLWHGVFFDQFIGILK